jgi:TonB family protein
MDSPSSARNGSKFQDRSLYGVASMSGNTDAQMRPFPMKMQSTVSFLLLLLLSACAADSTRYRVVTGSPDAPLQRRVDAEKTLADIQSSSDKQDLDKPLKILYSPFPEYPPGLRNDNFVGLIRLRFFVEADGTVSNPSIVGSPPAALAAISLHAIMRWKFEPPTRGGAPIRVPVVQEFVFRLE